MAKAKSASLAAAATTAALAAATASNVVTTTADGVTDTLNPAPVKEKTAQELKTEAAQAKIAAKAEKQAAAAAAKAEKEAAKAAKSTESAAERETKKAERLARLEALKAEGRNYTGSMLALADKVKSGVYVKGPTGQLHSGDELATALAGVQPLGVIQLAKVVLNLESNPYSHLNVGQQSMNLRNKLRGAIRKDATVLQKVKDTVVELELDVTEAILKAKAEKAERIAKAKEDKAAKAAAKPAKQEEEAEATA